MKRISWAATVLLLLTGCATQTYDTGDAPQVAGGPVTGPAVHVDGSCAEGDLVTQLKNAVAAGGSVVAGTAKETGATKQIPLPTDAMTGQQPETKSEISVRIDQVLAGGAVTNGQTVSAYVTGGVVDGVTTVAGPEVQNAWARDSRFFGTVQPDPEFGFLLQAVPDIDGAVVFPGIGCWNTDGFTVVMKTVDFALSETGTAHATPLESVETITLDQIRQKLAG